MGVAVTLEGIVQEKPFRVLRGNRGQSTMLAKALKTTRAVAGPCAVAFADGRANAAPHVGASPARSSWRSARCPRSTRRPIRRWSRRAARRRSRFRARCEQRAVCALTCHRAVAERPVNRVIADQRVNLSIGVGCGNSTSHHHADAGASGRAPDSTRHNDNAQGSGPRCRSARRGCAPPRASRSGGRPC
jgi:hypothetical protein